MKALEVLCRGFVALLVVSLSAATAQGAELLAQWNFNSVPPDGVGSTGTNVPSFGIGTAALVGGATATYAGGATGDPAGMADNSGWNTASYPAAAAGNKTRGVQFNVSTLGFERILVTWQHRNSDTSSRYGRFQYSTNGIDFIDGPTFNNGRAVPQTERFEFRSVDLTSIPAVNDIAQFAFRIVSEFEATATDTGPSNYVATVTNGTYGTTGTWRFDMVTVSGEIFSGNQFPSISSISNQTTRVNTPTPEIPFTVGDVETAADQLLVTASSSDQALVPNDSIFLGGSGSNRTVSISPAFDQTGSATITLTNTDNGGKFTTTSFLLTVLPANTPPTISSFTSYNTVMNAPFAPINFTVGDAESAPGDLVVTALSSNPSVVPEANLTFGGAGANRTLDVTPALDEFGNSVITVTVSDGVFSVSRIFSVMVLPSASVVLNEPFAYSDGSVNTNSGFRWSNHSGFAGQTQVTFEQLRLSSAQTEDISSALVGGPYDAASGKSLYAGFVVNFLVPPTPAGEFFAHFREVGGSFRGRVFASTLGVPGGSFRLGIGNNTGNPTNATMFPLELSTQSNYVVVVRYDVASGITTLWVNPHSESDLRVVATDNPTVSPIGSWAFRQSNVASGSIGTLSIDDLRVAFSFADAIPGYRLRIDRSAGVLRVSWPAAATDEGYVLETAAGIDSTWQPVIDPPNRVGSRDQINIANPTGNRFYRLVK